MTDGAIIDTVYGALVNLSHGMDYDLERFDCSKKSWGYKNTTEFMEKKMDFIRTMIRIAESCPILYGDGEYWLFDGRIYVKVREELIFAAYDQLMLKFKIAVMTGDRQTFKKYFADTIRFRNKLEPRHDVVAFDNGVLTLEDGVLHGFSPEFHVTYYHPYEYDPKARCVKWLNFLHEVLPDKNARMTLQMYLGLGLIDRGPVYNPCEGKDRAKVELCLILIGSGANGKSVIYNTAMGIFGKERISGVDYDELTAGGDEGMRARRLLRGALFNWSSDSDSRTFGRKRSGVFKRIVSSESVTDRKIGEDVKENDQMPYLIFNLNELPFPDDQSLGFIRRLQFISFDVTIPKSRQNRNLSQELVREYPGIFNWVVRGARELKRRKFMFPPSEGSRRQVLKAQLNINPVLAWASAYQMRCEPLARGEVGLYIPTCELLDSLAKFCEDNNVEMVSKQMFGQTMSRIGTGFFKKRFKEGQRYLIYGCAEERLKEPFIIENEDMKVDYIEEKGTYIREED